MSDVAQPWPAPRGETPSIADLLDPVALEARLADARRRRARVLAARAASKLGPAAPAERNPARTSASPTVFLGIAAASVAAALAGFWIARPGSVPLAVGSVDVALLAPAGAFPIDPVFPFEALSAPPPLAIAALVSPAADPAIVPIDPPPDLAVARSLAGAVIGRARIAPPAAFELARAGETGPSAVARASAVGEAGSWGVRRAVATRPYPPAGAGEPPSPSLVPDRADWPTAVCHVAACYPTQAASSAQASPASPRATAPAGRQARSEPDPAARTPAKAPRGLGALGRDLRRAFASRIERAGEASAEAPGTKAAAGKPRGAAPSAGAKRQDAPGDSVKAFGRARAGAPAARGADKADGARARGKKAGGGKSAGKVESAGKAAETGRNGRGKGSGKGGAHGRNRH